MIMFFKLFVLIICCEMNEVENLKKIDIFSPTSVNATNLSQIALDVEYIPLQSSEKSLFSYISDLKTDNDRIYINSSNPNEIFCFSKSGRFLHKLDRMGRGPEEYSSILDYDISPNSNLLSVLAVKKILIFKYTDNGFDYSKSISLKTPLSYIDFIPGQNSILLTKSSSYENEPFRNVIIDLSGDTLAIRPNNYIYRKSGNGNIIFKNDNISFSYKNNLCFKEMFNDTVYSVDESNNIQPYLILNADNRLPSVELRSDATNFYKHGNEYVMFTSIMEVSRYLIYSFAYKKSSYLYFYDKISNSKISVDSKNFLKDDISGGVNFEPKFCCNGKLYSWIDVLSFKKYISSTDFKNIIVLKPEKKKELKKLADSLDVTDNPILIVLNPKK